MFFDDKRKNLGAAILGHIDDKGSAVDTYEGPDVDTIIHSIAEDLIAAVHEKNTKGVVEALKAFMACAKDSDEPEPVSPN